MTIAAVQETGNYTAGTNTSKAFASDVTAGNLIVICGAKYSPGNDAFALADCTKSAGTATLDTIALATQTIIATTTGADYAAASVWSAIVTGSGSLTMQVGGGLSGSEMLMGIGEYSATNGWDASRLEDSDIGKLATNNSGAAITGDMTSAGGALFIGGAGINTGSNLTITADSPFQKIFELATGASTAVASFIRRIVTAGTTDAVGMSWTPSSDDGWAVAGAVYKEVAGAPPSGGFLNRNFWWDNL